MAGLLHALQARCLLLLLFVAGIGKAGEPLFDPRDTVALG